MSSFTSPLIVKHLNGKDWEVMQEFTYKVSNSTVMITVPVGYITDFASIPRFAWPIIGHPAGKHGKAAVIHDYLYSTKQFSRKRSDRIFCEAMKVLKVSNFKRQTMYYAVRWFGRAAWKKKSKFLKPC